MEITNLLHSAQEVGISVSCLDGQIKIHIPWPVQQIPDQAKEKLSELKKRQSELLAYFAIEEPFDASTLLAALQAQGVRISKDMKIYIAPNVPNRCSGAGIKLINQLHDHWEDVKRYILSSETISEEPPG